MKNVSFIFNVLADLAKYAGKKEMVNLEKAIFEAQFVARNEITQRKMDSNYDAVMEAVFPNMRALTVSDSTK